MSDPTTRPRITDEQRIYANLLNTGMYLGLVLLLVTFALYVSGVIAPAVPVHEVESYWHLSVGDYLETVNEHYLHRDHHLTGWWWLSALGHGDYLTFVGVAVLSAVTIVCFIGIVPTLLRKRDFTYAIIAVAEVLVLAAAASGILAVGH